MMVEADLGWLEVELEAGAAMDDVAAIAADTDDVAAGDDAAVVHLCPACIVCARV